MPSRVGNSSPVSVGVDVGGTFTDIVSFDSRSGLLSVLKFPTAVSPPASIVRGVLRLNPRPSELALISHATTLATNALLTKTRLGRAALITNEGFRDILEIGRQRRPELYNLDTRRPPPLIRRSDRYTVPGRISADGRELLPLDPRLASSVSRSITRGRYGSVAICFLNSYANSSHELRMKQALRTSGFAGHVSISSEVDNGYREFERTSTTTVNAVLAPLMESYIQKLATSLRRAKVTAPLYLMNSDGGATTPNLASSMPVHGIESGPAAGVVACKQLARHLSEPNVLTFDMGGTTAKAGAIVGGEAEVAREFEAAGRSHSGRSIRGSGYSVRGPFIDLAEVSAGGGTVLWADESGQLSVGPRSAGSQPGPACYGRGGAEPTITDANVLLGRLNPVSLLSGSMPIRFDLAERALSQLCKTLGTAAEDVAIGALRLVNADMARAISMVSVERGRDPRDFVLFAFGGAGPAHACDLAEELGIRAIVVPAHAGLFSAHGLLSGDLTRTFSASARTGALQPQFAALEMKVRAAMKKEGFPEFSLLRYAEARYEGQSHELLLKFRGDNAFRKDFSSRHRQLYDYSTRDVVEVVNLHVRASVRLSAHPIPTQQTRGRPGHPSRRRAWIGGEHQAVPVLTRETIQSGRRGRGPCIIEEYDSTLVVNPGWRWRAEEYGTRLER
ncbi:MAG: hydantoinase/oxoprolinase family protein [archaeon]|nr:MAG: hydantoinase/oxoprolinase family protein [archaeon]